jgi:hypothetical protein
MISSFHIHFGTFLTPGDFSGSYFLGARAAPELY